jgi:hypothetical protein
MARSKAGDTKEAAKAKRRSISLEAVEPSRVLEDPPALSEPPSADSDTASARYLAGGFSLSYASLYRVGCGCFP